MPVEELVLLRQARDLVAHPCVAGMRVALDAAEILFSDRVVELLSFLPNEGRTPGIRPELAINVIAGTNHRSIHPLLVAHSFDGVVWGIV